MPGAMKPCSTRSIVAEKATYRIDVAGRKTNLCYNDNFKKNIVPGKSLPDLAADAFVNLNGLNLALDFNVAFPKYDPAVRNELGKVRGCYANFQTRLKFKSYRKSYEFEDHFLVPVTFESNGCPGASTMAFLADVKRHLIQTENKNPKMVGATIRNLIVTTSASLARSLAKHQLAFRQECVRGAGVAGMLVAQRLREGA